MNKFPSSSEKRALLLLGIVVIAAAALMQYSLNRDLSEVVALLFGSMVAPIVLLLMFNYFRPDLKVSFLSTTTLVLENVSARAAFDVKVYLFEYNMITIGNMLLELQTKSHTFEIPVLYNKVKPNAVFKQPPPSSIEGIDIGGLSLEGKVISVLVVATDERTSMKAFFYMKGDLESLASKYSWQQRI